MSPGPIPNRSSDLSRSRDANRGDRPDLKKGESLEANIPEADPEWGRVATIVWNSLLNSGHRAFFEESDWAYAYWVCVQIDRHDKDPGARGSAQNMATISQAMTNLMMTEAERRRARIELEKPKPAEEPVHLSAVRDLKAQLGAE